MREIKFRAVHYKIGEETFSRFSEWGFIDHTGKFDQKCFRSPSTSNMDYAKVHEQYTGLKDKNGVEIYEGDIVKTGHPMEGEVYYSMPSFGVKNKTGVCTDFEWDEWEKFEVIGNIHQNPELL